jgi:hypothetical protein
MYIKITSYKFQTIVASACIKLHTLWSIATSLWLNKDTLPMYLSEDVHHTSPVNLPVFTGQSDVQGNRTRQVSS